MRYASPWRHPGRGSPVVVDVRLVITNTLLALDGRASRRESR